jgi:hypothetical protein
MYIAIVHLNHVCEPAQIDSASNQRCLGKDSGATKLPRGCLVIFALAAS